MSLFDTLIGSTSQGSTANQGSSTQQQIEQKNTTQNTTAVTEQNQQQSTSGQTGNTTATKQANTSAASGKTATSSLNNDVVNTVSGLISQLAGGKGQVNDIVSALISKAGTPAISDADVKAQQDAAKLQFGQGEAVDIGRAKNTIGSDMNTYSKLLGQKGDQDLATTLSGIFAQAKATNAQISTQQLMDALQGSSVNAGQVAQLVDALKGANTVSDTSQNIAGATTQDTTAQTIQQVLEVLNGINTANQSSTTSEDTAAQAAGTTSSNTQGHQGTGLLGMLF